MTKHVIATVVGAACALFLLEPRSFGESFTNLTVTGSSSPNTLEVTTGTATMRGNISVSGTASVADLDVTGNLFSFGRQGDGSCGVTAIYSAGSPATFSLLTRGTSAGWLWQHATASGGTATVMQIDASNRLILTGTAIGNPPQLVLDPNCLSGSTTVLTQQAADGRYVVNGGGSGGTVIGSGVATGAGSAVIGSGTAANTFSIALGYHANAAAQYSVAMGVEAIANGDCSTAIGWQTLTEGWGSIAMGAATIAHGHTSLAAGQYTYAAASDSTALGCVTYAGGEESIAGGMHCYTWGIGSLSLGAYNNTSGDYSQALGYAVAAQSYAQTVIGQYNVIPPQLDSNNWVPTDELFTIGNGTSQAAPSNAMVVKKNGDTQINGKLTLSGSSGGLVVSGTGSVVLINPAGDLSMGAFTTGTAPQ